MTVNYSMDDDESKIRERYGLAPVGTPHMAKRHKAVLAAMRTAADRTPGGEFCLSIADLVRLTGLSKASCAFARHDLLRWGLVERVHAGGGAMPLVWRVTAAPESESEFLKRAGISLEPDRT